MRLPLRHPPPERDATPQHCAYLEAFREALVGVPLGAAAGHLASSRSRGRHGVALQWHLGLAAHDSSAAPDWEGRIELKLVTLWRNAAGELRCDRQKVCEYGQDPWRKLDNVLWVFADRVTRTVVGTRMWTRSGSAATALHSAWEEDPHFGRPVLVVEPRGRDSEASPSYYLTTEFMRAHVLPSEMPGVLRWEHSEWAPLQKMRGAGAPWITAITRDGQASVPCPRCGTQVRHDPERTREWGWAPGLHGPTTGPCGARAHVVVDVRRLVGPWPGLDPEELLAGLESRDGGDWRLSDRVVEPPDHRH